MIEDNTDFMIILVAVAAVAALIAIAGGIGSTMQPVLNTSFYGDGAGISHSLAVLAGKCWQQHDGDAKFYDCYMADVLVYSGQITEAAVRKELACLRANDCTLVWKVAATANGSIKVTYDGPNRALLLKNFL